jgi:hypothetical protein
MKFARLLAAGKSLVNGNTSGRYQMREGMALPQFISPKNPFKQEAAVKSVAPSPVTAAPATAATESVSPLPRVPVALPAPNPRRVPMLFSRATMASVSGAIASWGRKVAAPVRALSGGRQALVKAGTALLAALTAAAKWTGEAVKWVTAFCLDHNPFSAIGKPKLAGIPSFGKPVVQTELSLERVKVVRNDLTHADLEVVRVGGGSK